MTKTLISTSGLLIQLKSGVVLIAAGHGMGQPGSEVFDAQNNQIGIVEDNLYLDDTTVDLAIVKITLKSTEYKTNTVKGILDQVYENIKIAGERAKSGTFVSMQSPGFGAQFGKIFASDADITDDSTKRKVTNVCLATYPSKPSDSGAPVLSEPSTGAICYGFHGGRVTHLGTDYAWFTPLDNIDLGE